MKRFLHLLVLLFTFGSFAQNSGEDKLGVWYMIMGNHAISNKLSIDTGLHLRTYEAISKLQHFYLQGGFAYKISSQAQAGIGYGYLNADLDYKDTIDEYMFNEHRIYENLSLRNNIGKFKIYNRVQLEERFMNFGYKYAKKLRIRYRLQAILPISHVLFIKVYNEILLNIEQNAFDQNRFHTSLGIIINPNYKLQIGYLKHTYSQVAFDRLQLGVSVKTDFTKKDSIDLHL